MDGHNGLSPRLRGNPHHALRPRGPLGSIPAPAGEPRRCGPCAGWRRVYPRACGGTADCCAPGRSVTGLSPRLRGNRQGSPLSVSCRGSIPAPAGEPRSTVRRRNGYRVYPRACGGTRAPRAKWRGILGLSPRLRGNRSSHSLSWQYGGSIPAPAGEP